MRQLEIQEVKGLQLVLQKMIFPPYFDLHSSHHHFKVIALSAHISLYSNLFFLEMATLVTPCTSWIL